MTELDAFDRHLWHFTWGVSNRGMYRADPPLHIVHREGNVWKTWCGGGRAHANINNVTQRKCPKCMALARQDFREYGEEDNDA